MKEKRRNFGISTELFGADSGKDESTGWQGMFGGYV